MRISDWEFRRVLFRSYRRLHILLEREGWTANHKRIYRLYRNAGLAVRKRRKRDRVAVERRPLQVPSRPNHTWSMDFVFDALANGRPIKCLTMEDDCTKDRKSTRLNSSH